MSKRAQLAIAGMLLVVALLFSGGCFSDIREHHSSQYLPFPQPVNQAPAPGMARIYFIRGYVFHIAAASSTQIADQGRLVGELGNGGYICWDRPAGVARLEIKYCIEGCKNRVGTTWIRANLPVQSGMTYYLFIEGADWKPKSITQAEASKYLSRNPRPEVRQWNAAPRASSPEAPQAGPAAIKGSRPIPQPNREVNY